MPLKVILSQAKSLGYSYHHLSDGVCRVFPLQEKEPWILINKHQDSQWILIVNDVPQLVMIGADVIDFLKKRALRYSRL